MGGYYFFNEVRANTFDFNAITSSFGLLGMLLTAGSSELSVPLLHDRRRGQYFWLVSF